MVTPYFKPAVIYRAGPRPIEERERVMNFMVDDHNQTHLCTNPSATGWWVDRKDELAVLSREKRCPLYVYNDETLNDTFFDLLCIDAIGGLFYAVNANPHPEILEKAYKLGAGFNCASSAELVHVSNVFSRIESQKLLFATTYTGPEEYDLAFKKGATVLINNLYPLRSWPDLFRDKGIFICIESESLQKSQSVFQDNRFPFKSGLVSSGFDTLIKLLKDLSIRVRGLHVESKSPFFSQPDLKKTASFLAGLSGHFPEASVFSFGSGIGILTKPGLDIPDFEATEINFETIKDRHPDFELWLVLGEGLVSHAGVLLTEALETVQMEGNDYVRINAGMELLARSALNGPHHDLVNFSKLGEKETRLTHITGMEDDPDPAMCCVKRLAPVAKGDILLITNTGACGCDQGLGFGALEARHRHYLRARKMCSVKI
jgi:diaminopimelate decarboxylase/aspartate kinase